MDAAREAAILLLAFQDEAPYVLKCLDEEDAMKITRYMLEEKEVTADVLNDIADRYMRLIEMHDLIIKGGVEPARFILTQTYGATRAEQIIEEFLGSSSERVSPFRFLSEIDPSQLATVLIGQSEQAISVILSYLPPPKASEVINLLPPDMKPDIIRRIVTVRNVSPDIINQVETSMHRLVDSGKQEMATQFQGGVKRAVQILQGCDRATERNVLDHLTKFNPDLAKEIRDNLFVFEDYEKLSDDDMVHVISRLNNAEKREMLAKALKTAPDVVRNKFFSNLAERVRTVVEDEIAKLPPLRLKDVEDAQREIASIARDLEDEGVIVIVRRGEKLV